MSFLMGLIGRKTEPDFYFAAQAFTQVAVMKRDGRDEAFLRHLERAHAIELLQKGANRHQAMSARWGGCLAIEDDLTLFEAAIRQGKREAIAIGDLPSDLDTSTSVHAAIYQQAGDFAARAAWEGDRTIYRRFLDAVA